MALYHLYLKQIMLQWIFSPKMLDTNWPGSWALTLSGPSKMPLVLPSDIQNKKYICIICIYYKWFLVGVSLKP